MEHTFAPCFFISVTLVNHFTRKEFRLLDFQRMNGLADILAMRRSSGFQSACRSLRTHAYSLFYCLGVRQTQKPKNREMNDPQQCASLRKHPTFSLASRCRRCSMPVSRLLPSICQRSQRSKFLGQSSSCLATGSAFRARGLTIVTFGGVFIPVFVVTPLASVR